MRIGRFWARGYRSLLDVELELGRFGVFYGENGSGKSNILAAVGTFFGLCDEFARDSQQPPRLTDLPVRDNVMSGDDRAFRSASVTQLGAALMWDRRAFSLMPGGPKIRILDLEVEVVWPRLHFRFSRLRVNGVDVLPSNAEPNTALSSAGLAVLVTPESPDLAVWQLHERLREFIAARVVPGWTLVRADRAPMHEKRVDVPRPAQAVSGDEPRSISRYLAEGRLKTALFQASVDPDTKTRQRFKLLRKFLEGPPLHRPAFEITVGPESGVIQLVESAQDDQGASFDVPLDLVGLGIAQIYTIAAQLILSGASVGAIEEPEAHLHAPTTGRQLRAMLARLVEEGELSQLLVATHSNLFDLDETGYFDVKLEADAGTVVHRESLEEVDRRHLYEPGPAKHALRAFLSYMPPDEIVFRVSDGSAVTASQMIEHLQKDSDEALAFLRDVHAAAVRMVKVKHASKASKAS